MLISLLRPTLSLPAFGLLLLGLIAVNQTADGGQQPAALKTSIADAQPIAGNGEGRWLQGMASDDTGQLPYQFFIPEQAGQQDLPLVVFLHGSGEAGTDNRLQMYADRNVGPTFFASRAVQRGHQAYVLAPQTPKKIRWASDNLHEYDFDTTPVTVSMKLLLELIDSMVELHQIDPARIYVGGLSRGGQGTWNAILNRPELFAAAFPMAGGGDPDHGARIAHLAIWAFHGTADRITPPRYSRRMYQAVTAVKPAADRLRLTEYEGGVHRSAWLRGHREPEFLSWIFKWRNANVEPAVRAVESIRQSAAKD